MAASDREQGEDGRGDAEGAQVEVRQAAQVREAQEEEGPGQQGRPGDHGREEEREDAYHTEEEGTPTARVRQTPQVERG